MKKCFSRYHLALFAISLLTCPAIARQVVWSGSNVTNVKDEDLVIRGDVSLPKGGTLIQAIHHDVTVYLEPENKDNGVKVKGNDAGPSQLYLNTRKGKKIHFVGKFDLEFIGSESDDALLIVQSGPGAVDFSIGECRQVAFTSSDDRSGAHYYVLMDRKKGEHHPCHDEYTYEDEYCSKEELHWNQKDCSGSTIPTLSFTPLKENKIRCGNATVKIGEKSLISYLSSNELPHASGSCVSDDAGEIRFDASSTGSGRMVLSIENTGAFIVTGSFASKKRSACITLDDIDRSTAAGHKAIWSICNSQGCEASAGLLVENRNENLFDLLSDPFGNLHTQSASKKFKGTFSGIQYGAVIGANGCLHVHKDSYLDYVGLSSNKCPKIKNAAACGIKHVDSVFKKRNPSALFIDGNFNPCSTPAQINLDERSALFFRSGVGKDGKVRGFHNCNPFTVDSTNRVNGAGNIVLDVEGELIVDGKHVDGESLNKIEILSLEVAPTGGSLFVGSSEHNFPCRTFEKEDGEFLRYNVAAFLINNVVNLADVNLSHTDENHRIFQENDIKSEPTYIGGERFKLDFCAGRPAIRFGNSNFHLHTSAAVTGLDLIVPNLVTRKGENFANISEFIFYANSPAVDNGTGRQLILGTQIGAFAANNCGFVNGDAHLDVVQQFAGCENQQTVETDDIQSLVFTTAANDASMNPHNGPVVRSVIHTLFLGNSSNISIGVNSDFTPASSKPTLLIDGNFFSFTTKGGPIGEPDTSNITGKGGMFVDLNGKVSINPMFRASFAMMVTKSRNGLVNLPASQVFFDDAVGIADWKIDLRNPNSRIIVPADQSLSDYTFNWIVTKKDFKNFVPYMIDDVNLCGCPPVTEANVSSLPVIQGSIDQLQIQGTRIGDPAQIMIDGGFVREVVFLNNNLSAEAPVAVITLQNEGFVGVGPADTSRDSLNSTTTLGANGITIIANGSGRLELNSDLLVNNVCAFVKGPDFKETDVLEINTTVPREIRIKSGGVLDLRSFNQPGDTIRLIGSLGIFVEPGATILMGGGTLSFSENTKLQLEAAPNVASFFNSIPLGPVDNTLPIAIVEAIRPHNELSSLLDFGNGLHNTDAYRVRIIGEGTIDFTDNAQAFLPSNTFLGVETLKESVICEIPRTDIEIRLRGNSNFVMGRLNNNEGGVLQVGNVQDFGPSHSVNFTLTIDGSDAEFFIGSYGFLGLGVGIERYDGLKDGQRVANEWLVDNLFNLGSMTLNFQEGQFTHDRIFSGDDAQASLIAISGSSASSAATRADGTFSPRYTLLFNQENPEAFELAGGGNIALINKGVGAIAPIVRDQNGVITNRLTVGILASTPLLESQEDLIDADGLTFFDALDSNDAFLDTETTNAQGRANAALSVQEFDSLPNEIRIGAVVNGEFVRFTTNNVRGAGMEDAILQSAIERGAVFVNIDSNTVQIVEVSAF